MTESRVLVCTNGGMCVIRDRPRPSHRAPSCPGVAATSFPSGDASRRGSTGIRLVWYMPQCEQHIRINVAGPSGPQVTVLAFWNRAPLGGRHPQADDDLNIGHRVYVAMTVLWYCPGLTPPLTCDCEWTRLVSEARPSSPVLSPPFSGNRKR